MLRVLSRKGFSLLEVLVAVVIVSILLAGSMFMTTRYLYTSSWDKLFDQIEQQFLDINVYALSGFSAAFAENNRDLMQVPEAYHLYFDVSGPQVEAWYLESRSFVSGENARAGMNRKVIYQKYIDFDIDQQLLTDISLKVVESDGDEVALSSLPTAVLITWANPFAELSFRFVSLNLNRSDAGLGDDIQIALPPQESECGDELATCYLTLTFERPGTTDRKSLTLSQTKGVYRDFY